jgi:probable F420-dependent oxidoreductase
MHIGVVYPQTEFGSDPAAIKDYAQTAESLGYTHIAAYDHVLGANPQRPGGWSGPYTYQTPFQEPFVLFAYLAGLTHKIGFTTSIIILPQRQTALVAKQAATLDVLSGGRLRLGVGLGWNQVEYAALNENFHNRGKRMEEQVLLLRQLWTQPLVNFSGKYHNIPDAGLNPLPVQQPIPIWFGGHAEQVLQRAAALGDGWMPNYRKSEDARPAIETITRLRAEAGRQHNPFGIEARLHFAGGNAETWLQTLSEWQQAGATHASINTMGAGLSTSDEHMRAIRSFAESVGLK